MIRIYKCQRCGIEIILTKAGRPAMYCRKCAPIVFKEYLKNRYVGRYNICGKLKNHRKLNYRELAMLNWNGVCEKCGKEPDIIHVHHIDKNRKNNNRYNLMVLCYKCHLKEHFTHLIFPDKTTIQEMRSQGFTFQEIGNHFGLSRQRIHQIVNSKIYKLRMK
jgi:hypothetical protein